jgi:hypothetical protein
LKKKQEKKREKNEREISKFIHNKC